MEGLVAKRYVDEKLQGRGSVRFCSEHSFSRTLGWFENRSNDKACGRESKSDREQAQEGWSSPVTRDEARSQPLR